MNDLRRTTFCKRLSNIARHEKSLRLAFGILFPLFFSTVLLGQKQVTGTVRGDQNKPLAGITVSVKNTNIGTSTNENGGFSIQVPQGSDVLSFSGVGYKSLEVSIGTQTA